MMLEISVSISVCTFLGSSMGQWSLCYEADCKDQSKLLENKATSKFSRKSFLLEPRLLSFQKEELGMFVLLDVRSSRAHCKSNRQH